MAANIDQLISKIDALVDALKGGAAPKAMTQSQKASGDVTSLVSELNRSKAKGVELSEKEIQNHQKSIDLLEKELIFLAKEGKIESDILEKQFDQLDAAQESLEVLKKQSALLEQRLKREKEISKIQDTLLGGLKSKLGLEIDSEKVNKSISNSLKNGGSNMQALGAGMKSFGNQATNASNVTNMLVTGWQKIYSIYQDLDKTTTDFARNTNMTRDDAWEIAEAYQNISRRSIGLGDTAKKWLQANSDINKQLGTGAVLSRAVVKEYSELKNVAKFEDEVMQSLVMSSALNSKTLKQSASDRLSGIKQGQMMYGIEVNQRQVMADIAKISASTRLNYMGQEQALAKASVQAKAMGIEFSKLEGIANSLMDFEGSITKQMEAEVLTGQTLNLERARYYALTNDVSGLMSEMNAQGITAEKFAGMNRIQQEAIAGAMGMQKEEMAAMFIERKAVAAYGAIDMEAAKQAYILDVQKNGLSKANAALGDKALATQLQQITNEERRELAMDKIANGMGELVSVARKFDDLLTKMLAGFSAIGSAIEAIGKVFAYISGMKLVQWLMGDGVKSSMNSVTKSASNLTGNAASSTASTAASTGSKVATNSAGRAINSATGQFMKSSEIAAASSSTGGRLGAGIGAISNMGGGMIGKLFKGLLKLPILSTLVEGIFANSDIKGMMAEGKTGPELEQKVGERTIKGLGGIAGASLGSGIAIAASATGVPTFLASALAASIGSIGGSYLAGLVAENIDATGTGKMVLDTFYGGGKAPKLAEGGLVTSTGMAKVDAGEVYLGANSLQILKDLVTETRQQNQYLQALVKKDTHISMDGQAVAGVVARNVITSYGNLLNPSSATYA